MMRCLALVVAALLCCAGRAGEDAPADGWTAAERDECLEIYFRNLDRHISAEFTDEPLGEVSSFLNSLTKVAVVVLGDVGNTKVTVRFQDKPIREVIDWICKEGKAAWTIAPSGPSTIPGKQVVAIVYGSPEKIAEIEKQYPEYAKQVADYRRRLPVVDANLRRLERRMTFEKVEVTIEDLAHFVMAIAQLNVGCLPEVHKTKFVLDCKDERIGVILDKACKASKTDWTVAPHSGAVCLVVALPETIAELEKKYPDCAKKVQEYRKKAEKK